jgi:hypothetical protein
MEQLKILPETMLISALAASDRTIPIHQHYHHCWDVADQKLKVDGHRIRGVWPTDVMIKHQPLVQLFRFSQDPIRGFYDYVRHLDYGREDWILVRSDFENMILTLPTHSNAKPSMVPLQGPWIGSQSHVLTTWIRHRMHLGYLTQLQLSLEEMGALLGILRGHLGGWTNLHAVWRDPQSEEGALLLRAFPGQAYEDVALQLEGLYHRIAEEQQMTFSSKQLK